MIDPDAIQAQHHNLQNYIALEDVPEIENVNPFNLDDDKEFNKYILTIKQVVRKSFEYRRYINFIRDKYGMNKDSFIEGVSNSEGFDIRIEIHHYPFSLDDIANIVYKKRCYYNENVSVWMVAKEIMSLHYKNMIGLIPLSKTVHELVHAHRLFIPINTVLGRYDLFVTYYRPFITDEQIDVLERIENYTAKQSNELLNNDILNYNKVNVDIKNENYRLPEITNINQDMHNRIDVLKSNNYMLPMIEDNKKEELEIPIIFYSNE